MGDYRSLRVWEEAHAVTLEVYRVTRSFPRAELYGLSSQMRRAAVSIPTNLAEGSGRGGSKDFARFVRISLGSASELEYQLLLARDLGYLDAGSCSPLMNRVDHIKRMLARLMTYLSRARA